MSYYRTKQNQRRYLREDEEPQAEDIFRWDANGLWLSFDSAALTKEILKGSKRIIDGLLETGDNRSILQEETPFFFLEDDPDMPDYDRILKDHLERVVLLVVDFLVDEDQYSGTLTNIIDEMNTAFDAGLSETKLVDNLLEHIEEEYGDMGLSTYI